MAVGELDTHAHALVGLALRQLAQDHPDGGDITLFSAVFKAWLGWAGEMHCPTCTTAADRFGAGRVGRRAAAVFALRWSDEELSEPPA